MILEAEFSPGMPAAACVEVASLVEEAGFDRLGVSDVVLWPDTYVVQALCARATSRVEIGPMVANPYLRHPAATAAAVATVAELSGGRAFLGFGVGAGLEAVGIEYERPVATLREATTLVRALLDGETVHADGTAFRLDDATLRMAPEGRVPIAIGTRSPQVAGLAGELADRALVGARYLSPKFAANYRDWVAAGARRAGRDPASVEIAPRLTLCASADRAAAYDTMRRDAAEFLVTLRPDDLAIEPERFDAIEAALAEAKGWYFDPEAYHPPELYELVDDELVEAFSLCGDGADLVAQFRRVAELGFSSVSLKLAPVRRPGWSMLDGLRETVTTAAEVLSEVSGLHPAG
ncbi:MAG: LLM class flavin-dependent oxidoreductase [Acidimicrobiales bacterium]